MSTTQPEALRENYTAADMATAAEQGFRDGVASVAASAGSEPVAWVLTSDLTRRETTTKAHLWFSDPVNCMWTPIFTTPQPAAAPTPVDPFDALRWGANVAETLLSIGRAIGFGRAQQILGEQWEAAHGCAPRGRMGVTVKDEVTCQMCGGKPYPGCNTEFQGEAACRFTHPYPPEGMVGGWMPIETAPVAGLILLVVEDSAGERRVFPAEASHENGVLVWQVTLGWLGWTRLHSGWTPILWRRIPTLPTTSAGSGKGE